MGIQKGSKANKKWKAGKSSPSSAAATTKTAKSRSINTSAIDSIFQNIISQESEKEKEIKPNNVERE